MRGNDSRFSFHVSTPPGEGGIAVIEVYGDDAREALEALFSRKLPAVGRSSLGRLLHPDGEEVDEAVVTRVPPEGMWCRRAAWLVSIHGGVWLETRAVDALRRAGGEPLTLRDVLIRSLEEGALDAVECAAFEGLLEARTERAAAFFARQHQGELSRRLGSLLACSEDESAAADEASRRALLVRSLEGLLEGAGCAYRLGHPLRVLIAGRPNSGKSTLFNALVERERAIVSERRGTTRDFLRETVAFSGFPVELVDSAGIHDRPSDPVEAEAIARVEREEPDAVLYLVAPPWRLEESEETFLARLPAGRVLRVATFADRDAVSGSAVSGSAGRPGHHPGSLDLRIAAPRGEGLPDLRERIVRRWLGGDLAGEDLAAPFTASQRSLLEEARDAASDPAASLDAVREVLVRCLRSSWPGRPA